MTAASREPLASTGEVAEYLRKSEKTLTQWRYQGIGPKYHQVGGEIRYRWSDVDEWLDLRAVDPAAPAA